MNRVSGVVLAVLVLSATAALAQESQPREDTRTQYPALLRNSYFSINVGAIDYGFSQAQLEPGYTATSINIPHVVARVALFGHEFNRFVSVQGTLMRPVSFVSYSGVNGDVSAHKVWMNYGGVTAKARLPLTGRVSAYGEGGLGITSRHGFDLAQRPGVRDAHYASPVVGGGVEYNVSRGWDFTGGLIYYPGKDSVQQPHAIVATGGFRFTMRPLPPEKVEENRSGGYLFPVNMVQLEYSTGYGYGVNSFVSRKIPVFWGGSVRIDRGVALHYDRNVFHTRKIFALDFGASASSWRSQTNRQIFSTLSVYPLFRFFFLRTGPADVYAVYSLAGPTYISQSLIDGSNTGNHFTFQDFMGLGALVGRSRNVSLGVKINHYSNGNIFTENAGLTIPITFNIGYAF
jgi:hypothetical protein